MPADKPPPLPTPPNLHALQNRIALSLSARASLLSRSSPSSSSVPKPKTPQQLQQQRATSSPSIAEELDLRFPGDANAGVGYVPEGQDALAAGAAGARDKVLRGRILGKGPNGDKANGKGKGLLRRAGEESDDEDLGRSALGRRKAAGDGGGGGKKRKRPVAGEDDDDDGVNGNNGADGDDDDGEGTASGAAGAEVAGRSGVADDTCGPPQEVSSGGEPDTATSTQVPAAAHSETTEVPLREKQKKNKKNKSKKKRKQGLP